MSSCSCVQLVSVVHLSSCACATFTDTLSIGVLEKVGQPIMNLQGVYLIRLPRILLMSDWNPFIWLILFSVNLVHKTRISYLACSSFQRACSFATEYWRTGVFRQCNGDETAGRAYFVMRGRTGKFSVLALQQLSSYLERSTKWECKGKNWRTCEWDIQFSNSR